jgi:Fe2+ or Zn2+ uptake regulation protein
VCVSTRYRTVYRILSFYHQAKIVKKTLTHNVLWLLYDILSLKNDVNVASKSNKLKKTLWNFFYLPSTIL